ncbi:hypothetical protein SDC9_95555 [bioreactor metagenome]|uniref:Uncharacterized protein n=1 Tax=bioreactor metagenome TaxID=1076179 RepID=A0A645A803_9ZZZZ
MAKHIVIETVVNQNVSLVVLRINCPVVTQLLGAKYQYTVISQFVIFDNGKCFECFSEPHTIGNNTTAIFFNFLDSPHYTIFLELVKFIPNFFIFKSGF